MAGLDHKEPRVHFSSTLFVRNLPYSTTDEVLQTVFSPYGKLRRAFVVKNKGESQCRGFGYVTYFKKDDAAKAKSHVKVISSRPVHMMFARHKEKEGEEEEEGEEQSNDDEEDDDNVFKSDSNVYDIGRTILITQLSDDTTNKQLRVRCRKIGNIESLEYPVPGKDELTASVTFKTHKEAKKALDTLQSRTLNGKTIKVDLLSKVIKRVNRKSLKKSRLIVRNISFKTTEDDLNELFSAHCPVISTQVVRNEKNKSLGYGFVQLESFVDAHKALKNLNETEFKGRKIRVDWVLPREKYQSQKEAKNEEEVKMETEETQQKEDEEEQEEEGTESLDEEEGDREEEEEEEEESMDEDVPVPKHVNDVKEGKTLFIRNVPYDVDKEDLASVFRQFGSIRYCRPVLDANTQKCKGSAFIQYKTIDSISTCIEAAKSDEGLWIGQDKLMVDMAVSKEELSHMKKAAKQQQLVEKDSRNLYLLEEGYIDPLSEAGQEMSKIDTRKRMKSLQERKVKLKNPHYFISKTRLSVRNLPASTTEKSLKSLILQHSDRQAIVKQVKLMRSKEQFLSDGLGRPVGFGFVEFKDHHSALTALRNLNNNPDIHGPDKRPIVEFALEDSRALKLMRKRQDKQKQKHYETDLTRGLTSDPSMKEHTNKRVEWQLKWKERRLRRKEAKKNKKEPVKSMREKKQLLKQTAWQEKMKKDRQDTQDKKRALVKREPESNRVLKYKKLLLKA
ncbi:PREDICTED: RNA-binding protein 28-like [Amphimedon queenslandica]|uniref:RRM domain-containing protein n=1 Tax=Amphimedon queenslandica TaxID=400682 RepID=A0A1X7VNF2_AMPQE|nr:PREDICTED: RNA-binding protein 28-like [Amphimedon queenslandica]|eukprot:XP_003383450.1 PREDICTED: RNA-binding protein 28-like [Amphimedon queenslandica]